MTASDTIAAETPNGDATLDTQDDLAHRDASGDVPLCASVPTACDPVNNLACPSPTLNCYLTSLGETLCTCPAKEEKEDAPCTIASDCAAGLVCVSDGSGETTCHAACYVAIPSCLVGTCVPIKPGAKVGFCG